MKDKKRPIRDSDIDHILEQLHDKKPQEASDVAQGNSQDVDAILASLGIGTNEKKRPAVTGVLADFSKMRGESTTPKASERAVPTPVAKEPVPTSKPTAPVAKPIAPVAKPTAPVAKPTAPVAKPTAPVAKPTAPVAKPVAPVAKSTAPVAKPTAPVAKPTAPVAKETTTQRDVTLPEKNVPLQNMPAQRAVPIQPAEPTAQPKKETATFELPSIKAFGQAQERRREQKEKTAGDSAFADGTPVAPQPDSVTENMLFGEVDERFRAFFGKTVAQDSPELEAQADQLQKEKKKNKLKRLFSRAYQDEDEAFLTGEFGAPLKTPEKVPVSIRVDEDTYSEDIQKAMKSKANSSLVDADDTGAYANATKKTPYKKITITMPLSGDGTEEIDRAHYRNVKNDVSQEVLDSEYNHLGDAPVVSAVLKNMRVTRLLRLGITGVLTLLLVALNVMGASATTPLPASIAPQSAPLAFLAINLVLLLAGTFTCITTVGGGIVGFWRAPTTDSLPAVAVIGALMQCVGHLFAAGQFDITQTTLFAPIAVLLLFGNTLGKWLQSKVVSDNFTMASDSFEHAAAFLVPNRDLARKVSNGTGETDPVLLVSRPTGLVRGFLRQSFSAHASDPVARKLALALLGGALLCAVVCGVRGKSMLDALSGFAALLCLGAPLASSLVYAVPALLLQQAASKVGAVVPGPSAVSELGQANTILLNAKDLFPASCVRLHGIKTFEKERIDLAILYATSLLANSCDTLRDTFLALIDNKTDMLYPVETPFTEQGYGFSGWIDNNRVIVGNRSMMMRHDIEVPSITYEQKYTKNGERSPIYLAVAGKAFGMFLVSYLPDAAAQRVLDELGESGVTVLLQTDDFNVTASLVAATYRLPKTTVKVLSQNEREMLRTQTDFEPETDGLMTHMGTCSSFVGGMRAAAAGAQGERLADVVQTVAVLFSIVLCLVLSFSLGIVGIHLLAVLLYQLAWGMLTIALPLLRKNIL